MSSSGVFDDALIKHLWSTDELRAIFNDANRVQKWYDFEAALALEQAELAIIPRAAAQEIAAKSKISNVDVEAIAAEVAATDDRGPGGAPLLEIELGAQLAVAFGEQQLAALELDGARRAYDQAEEILREAPAPALPDARFLALQGAALTAQLARAFGRAADRLRSIVRLASTHAAPRDELEARMALGHMLTQLGKHDEAMRHLDLARALAKECAGVDERMLAAQSAALAALHGKSYGRALERAYEALKLAGLEKRDLIAYVAAVSLIAEIHLVRESPSEAYLALVYAAASVKQRLGPHATLLLDAQIEELKRSMGPARFEAMCEEIMRAREARKRPRPT